MFFVFFFVRHRAVGSRIDRAPLVDFAAAGGDGGGGGDRPRGRGQFAYNNGARSSRSSVVDDVQ